MERRRQEVVTTENSHMDDLGRMRLFLKEITENMVRQMMQGDLTQTREDRRRLEDIHGKVDRLTGNLRTELAKCTDHILLLTAEPNSGSEDERRLGSGTFVAVAYCVGHWETAL